MGLKLAVKWVGNILTGLLLLFFVFVIYFSVSAKLSGGTPHVFGHELMTVISGSMEPVIHTGSIIAIKPGADPKALQVGNVITFHLPEDKNTIVTHRIMEVEGTGTATRYITKGDANDSEDPKPIPISSVIGNYANITIPYLGYILTFAKSKLGVITILIIPGAFLILWQMVSLFRTIARMEKGKKDSQKALAAEEAGNNV